MELKLPDIHINLPKVRWAALALALVVVPLFAILVWQLASLSPEKYCGLVKAEGVPPGNHCFELLKDGLKIKGWVIWLLIGTLATFVLMVLSALTKISVSLMGPANLQLKVGGSPEPTKTTTTTTTATVTPAPPKEVPSAPTSR